MNTIYPTVQVVIELGAGSNGYSINDDIKRFTGPIDIIVFNVYEFVCRSVFIMRCGITV